MFIVSLEFRLKNNVLGEYSNYCVYLGIMGDDEFDSWRDPYMDDCEETSKLEKYKKKHRFKSEWIVN